MPADHSTAPAGASKPAKPSPDFPLFAHATGRWAKKIGGKLIYFGAWSDHDGALQRYYDYIAGEGTGQRADSPTFHADDEKPAKPYPAFPLFPHATKRWAKKIRGQLHYFGPWSDRDGALAKYLAEKDDLHAGRKARPASDALTIKDLANAFLQHKQTTVDTGELSPRTWQYYKTVCELLVGHLGKRRLVSDLSADDFASLRTKMATRWGLHGLNKGIQYTRSVFKYAYDATLIDRPIRFGPGFARPSKKSFRLHRAAQGPKLFTAEEIHRLLGAAGVQLKAMILLGINAGMGNTDCGRLPVSALDLNGGWIDYPRAKTGVARRCWLWPETVDAIRQALAIRPDPKDPTDTRLVFVTMFGYSWSKDTNDDPIAKETAKLLRKLQIHGRKGLGFYTLRHSFRTIADEARDQPAADFIMGHESGHMSTAYRERIGDDRLRAVAEHVRRWLLDGTIAK
jgi:integrase